MPDPFCAVIKWWLDGCGLHPTRHFGEHATSLRTNCQPVRVCNLILSVQLEVGVDMLQSDVDDLFGADCGLHETNE